MVFSLKSFFFGGFMVATSIVCLTNARDLSRIGAPTSMPTEEPDCIWTNVVLNRDDGGASGRGDFELISEFQADGISICGGNTPLDILCIDTETELDFDEYPYELKTEYFTFVCEPDLGFLCIQHDDPEAEKCPDFEVEFCCPEAAFNV
jgi:hypothetical protein